MFVKADDLVARVAPSDSYCMAIERLDDYLAIKLTISGVTRMVCFNLSEEGLYAFLLEEINRFHEAFMAENRAMRSGQKPPASETVFTFRNFYETERGK